jgi:hypothetical protein
VLLLTPVYWLMKAELHAEYLMTLPLVALGVALARRLRHAGLGMRAAQRAPLPGGSG